MTARKNRKGQFTTEVLRTKKTWYAVGLNHINWYILALGAVLGFVLGKI